MSSSRPSLFRRGIAAVACGAAALATAAAFTPEGASASPQPQKPSFVTLQVLAINDFHGNLLPPTGSSGLINGVPAGGATYLSTHLQMLRDEAEAAGEKTITVAAGDLVGASPLLSAGFHDEPTIEAMNELGLEVASVGNHEFDEGWQELLRLQNGGCLPDGDGQNNANSCPDPAQPFQGADFQYLSANVYRTATHKSLFPGTFVKNIGGVKVGFIGMTLKDTPTIVTAAGVKGLKFRDEVRSGNAAARALKAKGVEAIIVLLHQGGATTNANDYNGCPGFSGDILPIAAGLSHAVDAIISGHTHQPYNCVLPDPRGVPRTVTSASSFGRVVTDLEFKINKSTKDIVRPATVSNNVVVTRDVATDPVMDQLIAKYQVLIAPIQNKVIGHFTGVTSVSRTQNAAGESPLGDLISDAQRADPTLVVNGQPVEINFMNPGGIRGDLVADATGAVTFGAAFTVQPFNNIDASMDLTGQQILDILEQQWSGLNLSVPKVLQVSGLTYTWSASAPVGSRVVPGSAQVNGVPLDPTQTYRVGANSFLADGGDNFTVFRQATNKYLGGLDIDALANYLAANDPYAPVATNRITQVP